MLPLSIEGLTKSFGSITAVHKVSFDIHPGEVFGLLGPNGAGKTTIISSIMTLQNVTEGKISVFGVDVQRNPRQAKVHIGYVPQELIQHGFFTVEEILKYHASYYGIKAKKDYIHYLLEKLHLFEHRKKLVTHLSGGMKRRLLIVKALLHKPKLLLLDEPTAGVDIELRMTLWQFIQELKQEKISILLTTHYLEEAEQLCDRIAILSQGTIKKVDTKKNMLDAHSSKRITIRLSSPLASYHHPMLKKNASNELQFSVANDYPISELLKTFPQDLIDDIQIKVGTLEDVMENVLKGST